VAGEEASALAVPRPVVPKDHKRATMLVSWFTNPGRSE